MGNSKPQENVNNQTPPVEKFPPRLVAFYEKDFIYLRDVYAVSCPPASAETLEKVWKHKREYLSLEEHNELLRQAVSTAKREVFDDILIAIHDHKAEFNTYVPINPSQAIKWLENRMPKAREGL